MIDDVLKHLALGVAYRTGPLAWTDLHAGGVFFCVVYRECIRFEPGGLVRRWCEIVDGSRPLDDELEQLGAINQVGTYRVSGRGYLECTFPDLELTGLPCGQAPDLLAFHAFRARAGVSFSLVYTRGTAES